jgi:hypothetical protein
MWPKGSCPICWGPVRGLHFHMAREVLAKRFHRGDTVEVIGSKKLSQITHVLHASVRQPQVRLLDGLWYYTHEIAKT